MKRQPPFDPAFLDPVNGIYNSNPDAAYVNGDPRIGRSGSIPPMESVDHPQRELAHLITHSGQTPSHADLEQVRKAVKIMDERAVRRGGIGVPIYDGLDANGVHKIRGLIEGPGIKLTAVEDPTKPGEFDVKVESTITGGGTVGGGGGSGGGLTFSSRVAYNYTGADQNFVVPSGVTEILVKLWAPGGGSGNANLGGPGGYTEAILPVTPAQTYKVVVGGGGGYTTVSGGEATATCPYGFGGNGTAVPGDLGRNEVSAGGGLTGIFLTSVSKANAKVVAGGGGGCGDSHKGGAGNDTVNSGGQSSTMTGQVGSASGDGSGGGGGGGYEGGDAGQVRSWPELADSPGAEGGSGFAVGGATGVQILYTPGFSNVAPNNSDADYYGTIGRGGIGAYAVGNPGFAVIYY